MIRFGKHSTTPWPAIHMWRTLLNCLDASMAGSSELHSFPCRNYTKSSRVSYSLIKPKINSRVKTSNVGSTVALGLLLQKSQDSNAQIKLLRNGIVRTAQICLKVTSRCVNTFYVFSDENSTTDQKLKLKNKIRPAI